MRAPTEQKFRHSLGVEIVRGKRTLVEAYFAPLGSGELMLPLRAAMQAFDF